MEQVFIILSPYSDMTTTLQHPNLMEQTIAAVQQLSHKFNQFEEETKNDLKEIKEGLLGNKYNKKGLVDRTGNVEDRVTLLEEENKKYKAMVAGAKWSAAGAAGLIIALFELIWKYILKQ